MSTHSWIRQLFTRPSNTITHEKNRKNALRRRTGLKFEALESRLAPAGGLLAEVNNGVFRIGDLAENIAITPSQPADAAAMKSFFITSPHGQAAPVLVRGTLDVAGTKIEGAFGFREISATGGVEITIADATTGLGQTTGVELRGADGGMILLNSGAAGVVTAEDATDGVGAKVLGVPGLELNTTSAGLTLAINTTGKTVNHTVTTPLGNVPIVFDVAQDAKRIKGAADLRVMGPNGPVVRIGSQLTMTESGTGLNLQADQATVDVYAGSVRAVTMGSATSQFTLTGDGLALVPGSYTVSSFLPLPSGTPVTAGQGNYPATPLAISANLGPLALEEIVPVLTDLRFGPAGVNIDLGFSATSASLSFGAGEAVAEGLTATFGIAGNVNPATGQVSGFTSAGAFRLTADTFNFSVPGVLSASAEGLALGYDPQATGEQEILRADAVTIDVEALGLTGEFVSSDSLPALLVRTDGFAFGQGTLTVQKDIQLGSALTISNPFVTLGNFSYFNDTGLSVGSFGIGAEGLTVVAGSLTATGTDVLAEIGFDDDGALESFTFTAGELVAEIGGLVTLSATEVEFVPTATGTDTMLALGSATATVDLGGLDLSGSAGAMTIGADGSVTGPDTLSVSLDFSQDPEEVASKFKWPSFLPIQLRTVRLEWPEFRADPEHFVIGVSAGIVGKFGPLDVSGGVDNLVIDPYRVRDNEFPIIALDGFSVSAEGDLFGGEVSAGMSAGIIKLDDEGNVLGDGATEFASTVFYGGIEGSFAFSGVGGIGLRLGFSEFGLHQAYLSATIPGGITIDPVSGLTINNFRGGITFNATPLPVPGSPDELAAPIFKPTMSLTAEQWREQLKQQVANQASSGSRIFTVDDSQSVSDAIAELNSLTISSGGVLDTLFTDNGYALVDGGTVDVTVLAAGSLWLLRNQGATYVVESVDGILEVTEALFTLESALASALGQGGIVSQSIVAAFRANNIVVSTNAVVEVLQDDQGTPTKWKITDGDVTFFVTVRGNLLTVTGGAGSIDDMSSILKIEAGGTLYSKYISENAFKADVDIIITTDGKFLIVGTATLAESVTADVKLFGDLSGLGQEDPEAPLKLVFLANMPSVDSGLPQAVTVKGEMTFEFLDGQGNLVNPIYTDPSAFRFQLLGRAEVKATEQFMLVFGGSGGPNGGFASLTLTVQDNASVKSVQLDVSGSLSVEGVITAEDAVSAAGTLIFQKPANGDLEVFGAVKLEIDSGSFSMLADAGLAADAEFLLAFNSTTTNKTVELELPGRKTETVELDPTTFALEGEGSLTFANAVGDLGAAVSFDGAFSIRIAVDSVDDPNNPDPTIRGDGGLDLDVFVAGRLDAGLSLGGTKFNLLTLDGLGLVAVRDVGAIVNGQLITPEVAGRMDLFIQYGSKGIFEAQGSVQMLLNTTGQEFVYVIPDRLQDRLKIIQARRLGVSPEQVTLPPLPAVNGQLSVIVPDRPPSLGTGDKQQFNAGPYFALQFGDWNETGTVDKNGNGLTDVSVTILDAFRIEGDLRVVVGTGGFEMAASASATIAIPGVGDLFTADAVGLLRITDDGLVGALGLQAKLDIPGVDFVAASGTAYLGINTTGQTEQLALLNRPILARTAEVYLEGALTVGGLDLEGDFRLLVGAQSVEIEVDASVEFFDVEALAVTGMAAVYYGPNLNQNGFVLDASLSIGGDGTFGVNGIFEIGGSLDLSIDTRLSSFGVEVALTNGNLSVLDALEVTGNALITFNGGTDPYFRVEGSFSGNLLDVVSISASGFFDSRGYFGLNLEGALSLGTDDFGISASGQLYIEISETVPLDFRGSAQGEVNAFGITLLGAGVSIDYDGPSNTNPNYTGAITAKAEVTVLGITEDVEFTVGYLKLNPEAAPVLGWQDGNTLNLNVGDNGKNRALMSGEINEGYIITSLGAGSTTGEKIRVRAFGSTQTFDNITSIFGDFGSGNDQVRLLPTVGTFHSGFTASFIGGDGNDILINESSAVARLEGGRGNDKLFSQSTPDTLLGQIGDDLLTGGAGATLEGGNDNDELRWRTNRGTPAVIDGGTGTDTFIVDGQDFAESFNVSATAGLISVGLAKASNIEQLTINGRGGADAVSIASTTLPSSLSTISLNLSQTEGNQTNVDDGSADTVTILGDGAANAFSLSRVGEKDAQITTGTRTIKIVSPGKAHDTLTIRGGDGGDTFTIAGSQTNSVNQLLAVSLQGEGGNDKFTLPVTPIELVGGTGDDNVTFTVNSGDATNIALTSTTIKSGSYEVAYPEMANVTIQASLTSNVTVESTHAGTTTINLTGGGSQLTVKSTTGPVSAIGSNTTSIDRLIIDTSASPVPRVGSMTSSSVSGLVNLTSYSQFEDLTVNLGAGSDQFTILSTGPQTKINTGAGVDEVLVRSVSSVNSTTINDPNVLTNETNRDILTAEFTNPLTAPSLSQLRFTVGKVQIRDISTTPSAVAWKLDGGRVFVGTRTDFLLDTQGVPTFFDAGATLNDSLTIVSDSGDPQVINAGGSQVLIQEGANVASYRNFREYDLFSSSQTVNGLDGANAIVFSPDGQFVYATGQNDNAVSVYRRNAANGALSFVQVLQNGVFGVEKMRNPQAITISPDGKNVYVGTRDDAIVIFERMAATGRLVYRGFYQAADPIDALAISPNGLFVYAASSANLLSLNRNAGTGQLSSAQQVFLNQKMVSLGVSTDGNSLFAASDRQLNQIRLTNGAIGATIDFQTGFYTDLAVGPNSTVYGSRRGGVDTFTYSSTGLTLQNSQLLPSASNPATATAIAVSPNGGQVIVAYDTNSVPVNPPEYYLQLVSLSDRYGQDKFDTLTNADELSVRVGGIPRYFGVLNGVDGTVTVSLTDVPRIRVFGTERIEVVELDDLSADDELINSLVVLPGPGGSITRTLTWQATDAITNQVSRIQLVYRVYDGSPVEPTIAPVVTFTRNSSGLLSAPQQVSIAGITSLGDLAISPDGQHYFGASENTDQLTVGGSVAVTDQQVQKVVAPALNQAFGMQTTLFGNYSYSVNSKYGVLSVATLSSGTGNVGIPDLQVIPGGFSEGSQIAISPDGTSLYVTNPAEDSVFVYRRDTNTGLLTLDQVLTDGVGTAQGLAGAGAIVAASNTTVYVAGIDDNAIAVFTRNTTTGRLTYASHFTHAELSQPSSLTLGQANELYVTSSSNGKLFRLAGTTTLTLGSITSNGVGGVLAMSQPTFAQLSPDLATLYVSSPADNSVTVFARASNGSLTFVQSVINGQNGVQAITAANSLVVSSDGRFVLVAGAPDTMAVFERNATTGALRFLQRMRDGANGFSGLNGVTDLDVRGSLVYVSSGGDSLNAGGLAILPLATTIPVPQTTIVTFQDVESLTIRTGEGSDSVTAGDLNIPFTLETNGGADDVTLRNTANGVATSVVLGSGNDSLTLLSTGTGSNVTIQGNEDNDSINVYATGSGGTTTINGGSGNDDLFVDGLRLGSAVNVIGDAHTTGDTLFFDAHGFATNPANPLPPSGTVKIATANFGATYTTIENLILLSSPTAEAGGPYFINEGFPLTLNAGGSIVPSGQTLVGYEWGVGRGTVTGASPTLTWNELKALGIDDSGVYTIALKITTQLGNQTLTHFDTATVTVFNTAPTRVVTGDATVEVNTTYTLNLSATDPGNDSVRFWTINWGDGQVETFNGNDAVATHVYSSVGPRTISISATDDDVTYPATTKAITVLAARSISGPATGLEGSVYTLTLGRGGTGLTPIASWSINWGDGTIQTIAGDPTTATHTYADNGNYVISAVAIDANGQRRDAGNTVGVAIADVAPRVVLTSPSITVVEGIPDAFTLNVQINDPGQDTVLRYTVDWGDGTFETVRGDVTQLTHTYTDTNRTSNGTIAPFIVRISEILNDDGTFTNLSGSTSVLVQNARPVIVENNVPALGQENQAITLEATARSVITGSETLSFAWRIIGPNGQIQIIPAQAGETFGVPADSNLGYEFVSKRLASFTPRDNGTYFVQLTVSDNDFSSVIATMMITVANLAPTITSFDIPPVVAEGSVVTLRATATDPAGAADPLTYTWTITRRDTDESVTLTGATVNWPSTGGEYIVRLDVRDGDGGLASESAPMLVANVGPTIVPGSFIVPMIGDEGGQATFQVAATDTGTGNLSYEWRVDGPNGRVVLHGTTVNYTWPDDGVYRVSVTITDAAGASVTAGPATTMVANLAPTISVATIPGSGSEGVALTFNALASDPAGSNDALEYRWTITAPDGSQSTLGGAQPSFTPPDDGIYTVGLTVSDLEGGVVTRSLGTITVANVNPLIGTFLIPAGPRLEGQQFTLNAARITDVAADLADLEFAWTVTAPNGDVSQFTGNSIQFPFNDNGTYSILFVVNDGDGGQDSRTLTFTAGNVAPTITSVVVPTLGYVGFPSQLSAAATDVPGDVSDLTYLWTVEQPNGQTWQGSGPSIPFTPTVDGSHRVRLVITDGDGGTVTAERVLSVAASTVSITSLSIPTTGRFEAETVTLTASAVDAFGSPVSLLWTVTPPTGQPFTLTGSTASFTPPDDGAYLVSLRAVSANGQVTTTSTVQIGNLPPVLTSVNISDNSTAMVPVPLAATATDPAGQADPLTYTWTITNPDGSTVTLVGASASFIPPTAGMYGVELVVTDGDGGQAVSRRLVPVVNAPPVASAGGPYTVSEYGVITLDALTGSSDDNQNASSLIYEWDFDNDGQFGETSTIYGNERGATPLFLANLDGPNQVDIRVRVTDSAGASSIANGRVIVQNAAPTATVTGPTQGVRGQSRTFTFTAADLSPEDRAAGFEYLIQWGDGQSDVISPTANNGSGVTASHVYTANGTYTVTVRARDKDGGLSAPQTWTIRIVELMVENNVLTIGGTNGDDEIELKPGGGQGGVRVFVNCREYGPFFGLSQIEINALAGNDEVEIQGSISVPSRIDGGDGNDEIEGGMGNDTILGGNGNDEIEGGHGHDQLFGGAGNDELEGDQGNDVIDGGTGHDELEGDEGDDILLGQAGNDSLRGGEGRDLLIGGLGADNLNGGSGDDLLIAGFTAFDNQLAALNGIMAEWTSSRSYAQRVANIRGTGTGPRENGSTFLRASGPQATVFDDNDVDALTGGSGNDWFFVNFLGGIAVDQILDRQRDENADELTQ